MISLKKKVRHSPCPETVALLQRAGSGNYAEAMTAQQQYVEALNLPLRDAVLRGDIIAGIFQENMLTAGQNPEYPKSFITPDNQDQFVAYVYSNIGRIVQRQVASDYVMVPTYPVVNSIDCPLRYLRDMNWMVLSKMREVLLNGHVVKKNHDGFNTLMGAGAARNVVVIDSDATSGVFTKRLVSLLKSKMTRLGGGNSASMGLRRLTDLFISVESAEDMRAWDLTQVDDLTRREIFISDGDMALTSVFGVRIHSLYELGDSQLYQNYMSNVLGLSLSGKSEFVIGLDLANNDSFVMPVREGLSVHVDPYLHRELRYGEYSMEEFGFGVLDNRNVLIGAA